MNEESARSNHLNGRIDVIGPRAFRGQIRSRRAEVIRREANIAA